MNETKLIQNYDPIDYDMEWVFNNHIDEPTFTQLDQLDDILFAQILNGNTYPVII